MTKEQTKELNNYHQISITDLVDDCELELENGLKLRFIGQIDIRNNQEYLFKTLFSPFATVKWSLLSPERIHTLKVVKLTK